MVSVKFPREAKRFLLVGIWENFNKRIEVNILLGIIASMTYNYKNFLLLFLSGSI